MATADGLSRTPFEHDVFVSYAHGRRAAGVKRLKHWSERLKDELDGEIVDLLPEFEPLDIFIDEQLDPTQPLTDCCAAKSAVPGSCWSSCRTTI